MPHPPTKREKGLTMFDTTDTNVDTGTTNAAPDTTAAEAFANAFGVYPADNSTPAEPADEPQADQPEAKAEDKAKEQPKDDGKDYTIKYKGNEEVLHLNDDQLKAMLQKGRDYDEVRKQRDDLTAKSADLDTLNAMADYYARNNGISRKELLDMIAAQTSEDGIRAQIEADYPDISEEARTELIEARVAKLHAQKEAEHEAEAAKDIAALKAEYPDADIDNLPSEVQADIENGMKPLEAYRLHELKELRKAKAALDTEIDALKKEKDNRSHSLGRIDDNAGERGVDAFTTGFKGYMGG